MLLGGHLGQGPVHLGKLSTYKNTSNCQQPPCQNQIPKPGPGLRLQGWACSSQRPGLSQVPSWPLGGTTDARTAAQLPEGCQPQDPASGAARGSPWQGGQRLLPFLGEGGRRAHQPLSCRSPQAPATPFHGDSVDLRTGRREREPSPLCCVLGTSLGDTYVSRALRASCGWATRGAWGTRSQLFQTACLP